MHDAYCVNAVKVAHTERNTQKQPTASHKFQEKKRYFGPRYFFLANTKNRVQCTKKICNAQFLRLFNVQYKKNLVNVNTRFSAIAICVYFVFSDLMFLDVA